MSLCIKKDRNMQDSGYNYFGALVSCTGNAIPKIERLKELVDLLQKMDYNYLELGMENLFEVDGEPEIGYLNGVYTKAEIKDLEMYALARGITIAPCIQTLGYMDTVLSRPAYAHLEDINGILMVDEPETYELIEKLIKTMREYFSTDVINLGMDEAHLVGLGRYLDKNGYVDRKELLIRHLHKVVNIATKYGFKPHVWSDLFIKLEHDGDYYPENPTISKKMLESVPENLEICYWDYGEHELKEEIFANLFKAHNEFNREVWYAGGAWCWGGFAPFNHFSLLSMEMAIRQAKAHNVKNIMVTLWSSDGGECPFTAVLPSLYAIREYSKGNFDEKKIAQGFKETFDLDFYDFMSLDLPNKTSRNKDFTIRENSSKSLFYNDCFLGFLDYPLSELEHIPFEKYAKSLREIGPRMSEYRYLYDNLANLCDVLSIKAELGLKTRDAYKKGDKKALERLCDDYLKCAELTENFYRSYREMWLYNYKPFGWELQSIRFAGLIERLKDCRLRILDYLSGKIDCIPELEKEILPWVKEWGVNHNSWRGLICIR